MLSGVCDYNFPERAVGRMPLFTRGPNLRGCPEAVRRDVPAEARVPSWEMCIRDRIRSGREMDQDVHMLGRIVLNAGDFNFSLFRSGDNGICLLYTSRCV